MTEFVVALKITGDASSAQTAARGTKVEVVGLGEAARSASAESTAAFASTEAAINRVGDVAEQVTAKVEAAAAAPLISASAFKAEMAMLVDFMSTEAKSLDDVIERRAAYNEALSAGFLAESDFAKATKDLAAQEKALNSEAEKYTTNVASLVDKYSGAGSAAQRLKTDEDALNQAFKAGKISAQDHASALAGITAKLSALKGESAGVTQELGRMTGEGIRGNFQRLEGSAVTLAQRAGVLDLAFTGVGAAIIAVGGIAVGLAASFVKNSLELDSYNTALIATGHIAGQSGADLKHMADDIGSTTGQFGNAEKAVLSLAGSGRVLSSNLETVAAGAVNLSRITGESIDKSVAAFVKLGDQPVRASEELNQQLHYLTPAILDAIAAQERAGNVDEAAAIAQQALAAAVASRATEVEHSLSGLRKYWDDVATGAHLAWQSMLNIGSDAVDVKMDALLKKIEDDKFLLQHDQNNGDGDDAAFRQKEIAALTAEYVAMTKVTQAQHEKAKADAEAADREHAAADAAEHTSEVANTLAASMQKRANATSLSNAEQVQAAIDERVAAEAAAKHVEVTDDLRAAVTKEFQAAIDQAQATDQQAAAHKSAAAAAREMAAAQREAANDGIQLNDMIAKLSADTDPLAKATSEYNKELDFLAKSETDYADAGQETDAVLQKLQTAFDLVNKRYADQVQLIELANQARLEEGTALDKLFEKYRDEEDALNSIGAAHEREQREASAAREAEKAWADSVAQALREGDGEFASWLISQHDGFVQRAKDHADYVANLKQEQGLLHEWANTAEQDMGQFANSFAKDLVEGGSMMKSFGDLWKQVVEQMIAEAFKLAVIGPIMNAVFGTNSPTMSTAQGALGMLTNGSGGGGGGLMSSLFGGSGQSWASSLLGNTGGAGSGVMGFLFGGAGSYDMLAGDSLASMGAADELGLVADYGGEAAGMGEVGGSFGLGAEGSTGGLLSSGGDVGAGVGNFAGMAGGALAGWQLGYQLGGTAGGLAGAAGLATAAYFVPVIGWIAGALALLNTFTGGNVFGTQYKPTGVTGTAIDVDSSGASVDDWYQEHKHGALFSSGRYKNVHVDPTDDQTKSIDAAFDSVQSVIDAAAKALGETAGEAIEGSWSQTTDKTGKVLTQESEVFGQKYSEDVQHFFERIAADSEEALLPQSAALTAFYDQFQSNADNLADAATMLVAAQIDVNRGMSLLGDADTDLADIADEVQSLQGNGESLTQTYVRLQGEVIDFNATMDELGLSTGKTGTALVDFVDDTVKAAGGLDKLAAKFNAYYNDYYSPEERQSNAKSQLEQVKDTALSGIGEDPKESMAQFRADFEKALPNLTPDELNKWLDAAGVLALYTNAVTSSAQAFAKNELALHNDDYLNALANATQWEEQQIETANQLAQAAGLASASQEDLAEITQQGTAAIGKAFVQLVGDIDSDLSDLHLNGAGGTSDHDLLLATSGTSGTDPHARAEQAQQKSTAYDLIQKLGDYAFASGETVEQALKDWNLTPDKLAKILGVDDQKVEDQLNSAKDSAASLTTLSTNSERELELLQNLIDVTQGKPPTYDISATPPATPGPVTKPGVGVGTLPTDPSSTAGGSGGDVATAVTAGTKSVTDAIVRSGQGQTQAIQRLLLNRGVGNRSERSNGPYRVLVP
jgi:phage-related minor tail protein